MQSENPSTGSVLWEGNSATILQLQDALLAAAAATDLWKKTQLPKRKELLSQAHSIIMQKREEFAEIISNETGKPFWETRGELNAVLNKFAISYKAYDVRCAFTHSALTQATSVTRHKPHGVAAVLGPYNFPAHLPNGHIIPALLAGNTIVYKPSELTPATAAFYTHCLAEAGLPPGVFNLVQGGSDIGAAISENPHIDALFFTGSWLTGRKILEKSLDYPNRILALEMGGNNPLIVWDCQNILQAALTTIHSAYITTGQRCSCARRLIVQDNEQGNSFVNKLVEMSKALQIGPPSKTNDPFMGPLINAQAAQKVRDAYNSFLQKGAKPIMGLDNENESSAFVSPILLDCTEVSGLKDEEIFGPFLQLYRTDTFENAIALANNTSYGLCAGILTDNMQLYSKFWQDAKAGIINWNAPLTGASSNAPFGGLGKSGNHRPSAYYAADYCAYPVASMEAAIPSSPFLPQGITIQKEST
jgi:succinylglutamic semialdehyde dehydrogenase